MNFKKYLRSITSGIHDENGGITVFTILWLSIILGVMVICLDVGKLMIAKHELQASADAAVLAGASTFSAEYMFDTGGNITGVKAKIDKLTADALANIMLNRNSTLKNLISQDIKIISTDTKVKDSGNFGLPEYSIKISADVKMNIMGIFGNGLSRVTVIARADVNLN